MALSSLVEPIDQLSHILPEKLEKFTLKSTLPCQWIELGCRDGYLIRILLPLIFSAMSVIASLFERDMVLLGNNRCLRVIAIESLMFVGTRSFSVLFWGRFRLSKFRTSSDDFQRCGVVTSPRGGGALINGGNGRGCGTSTVGTPRRNLETAKVSL